MLPTPVKFTLVAGSAEGPTPLNAFDNALLVAGVGNLNLVKVSSILPPGATFTDRLEIPPGSLTPIAYGCRTSESKGELISAAVAVGLSDEGFGVIMEFSGEGSAREAEDHVLGMVREAFKSRGSECRRTLVKSVEHRVSDIGCAFAAVALWY
ncbi:MAG: arginine decarboxylase, pyruvoyl-dependent [Firmicutes bacterium]|nr:arginine decarboxylase, pyruvoyl-dependent [Bacillota bacterium]